jgi:tryptophanyl-tRNA synthetase
MSHKEVEKTFTDSRYGEFKMAVGECVAEYLNPINLKFTELEKENISESSRNQSSRGPNFCRSNDKRSK